MEDNKRVSTTLHLADVHCTDKQIVLTVKAKVKVDMHIYVYHTLALNNSNMHSCMMSCSQLHDVM